jgi:hypothetical protein
MKKIVLGFMGVLFAITCMAQTDSAQVQRKNDTIRIGGMIILKKEDPNEKKRVTITIGNRRHEKSSNISTAAWIIDLGFANWVDKTNYASAKSDNYLVTKNGTADLTENDFKLKTIKSVNVNIWFFIQRLNLIKHYVNLKYGLGLEMNNYRFKSALSLDESGTNPYTLQNIDHSFIFRDSINFSKNKLAADYVTIPFMLNLRTNPINSDKGLSFSAGVSVGYLYSSRNKQISDERGKLKNHGNYDLEKWKFSYIAELGLGPAHLYGSYSPNSIFEKGLNFMPYNVGIRLSNW